MLAGVTASVLAAAGCSSMVPVGDTGTDDPDADDASQNADEGLPTECPVSQDLGVAWPEEVDRDTAVSFVAEYEEVYYREVVVGYEPASRVDSYELGVRNVDVVAADDVGYEVEVVGGGGIYTPHLLLDACVTEPPPDSDSISADRVDDGRLERVLAEAVEEGGECGADDDGADRRVGPGSEVDRYLDVLEALAGADLGISAPGDAATLYFRVEDTPVELRVVADRFHGDRLWAASYHVDDGLLRRATGRDADAADGELLECRPS